MKNESEGTLIKMKNEAEARKIQLTLEAEGDIHHSIYLHTSYSLQSLSLSLSLSHYTHYTHYTTPHHLASPNLKPLT